ncbi:MAG: hypothetical protein J2P50_00920 [Hyphomicrobiaceae bacterium]|nr:hypothetical protein [Hyphomicrobiaceae bacterium]
MSSTEDWTALRRQLQSLAREVGEEVRSYPGPIPACDAQFNHLLDLRRMLPHELERLDAAMSVPGAKIEAFIRSSPCREALSAALIDDGRKAP